MTKHVALRRSRRDRLGKYDRTGRTAQTELVSSLNKQTFAAE